MSYPNFHTADKRRKTQLGVTMTSLALPMICLANHGQCQGYPLQGTVVKSSGQVGREVDLIANGQIKHVVRADRHRGQLSALEGIGLAGMTADLILQFERTR